MSDSRQMPVCDNTTHEFMNQLYLYRYFQVTFQVSFHGLWSAITSAANLSMCIPKTHSFKCCILRLGHSIVTDFSHIQYYHSNGSGHHQRATTRQRKTLGITISHVTYYYVNINIRESITEFKMNLRE
jgi:hypothetical protein